MLKTFRQGGVIQLVMGVVIFLIIAAFALEVRGPSGASFDTECAVRVSGRCVAPRDFTAAFQLSVRPDLTAKELKRLGIRKMILDGLVERELLLAEARRLGIGISDEQIDAELALGRFHFSLPAERDGQLPMATYVNVRHPQTEAFNYEIYQRAVRNYARMSTKDFKKYQENELIAARMRDLSKLSAHVSEAEAYAEFESESAKATVRVAQLDRDWFARFGSTLTDDEVRAYITAHMTEIDAAYAGKEAGFVENCPLVSEIFFGYPPAADEADEKETRERAERVVAELTKSPDRFDVLARVHSLSTSGRYGGRRGCLVAAEGDEESAELVKAVESLSPGGLSQLVTTSRGIYLLRLEQRVSKDDADTVGRFFVALPMAMMESSNALMQQYVDGLKARLASGATMQDAVDQLTREALKASPVLKAAGPKASELEAAALESRERPQVDVSPSFSRGGVTSPVSNAVNGAAAKQAAFSLKAVGDVYAEPIDTVDGVAVLQLKDKEPARREDFDKNKAEYISEFKARAESDALTAFVARLKQAKESEIEINERFLDPKTDERDDS